MKMGGEKVETIRARDRIDRSAGGWPRHRQQLADHPLAPSPCLPLRIPPVATAIVRGFFGDGEQSGVQEQASESQSKCTQRSRFRSVMGRLRSTLEGASHICIEEWLSGSKFPGSANRSERSFTWA